MKIAVLLCIVVLIHTTTAFAQTSDGQIVNLKIYFPYDQSYIDPTYMDNERNLHLADSLFRDSSYIATLSKIEVVAQSSPEGSVAYNEQLSERRKLALQKYFTTAYPQIAPELWSFGSVAENWELFHQHLVDDPNLPSRERVLSISESDRTADDKEWLLKTMDEGQPWLYIKENILPSQRFGASILLIPALAYSSIASSEPLTFATDSTLPQEEQPIIYSQSVQESSKLLFAIKTNLVLDLLSVINIAAEVPIGERWSVVGEVVHPWWRSWPADFTMQIESYHAELKYWLGDRASQEQLQGWSVGAYGGWGRYDIQPFSRSGVQGTVTDFGLEVGYAHSIARNLNLEYTVGLGYVSTQYEEYKMAYDTDEFGDVKVIPYPWMQNSLKTILPTRCGVSLVWLIKTRGGAKR